MFLAEQGYDVSAVDQSPVGLAKARKLAEQRGVSIETVVADLGAFTLVPEAWDGIVSIFAHVPPLARRHIHSQVATGLRPGGVLLLEAYRPEQFGYRTGGPPVTELMMTVDGLREELSGLDFDYCAETVRDIQEGPLHHGDGAVIQLRARRPH